MKIWRFQALQRTLTILLLFTGLLSQIQVVFACNLMDDVRSSVCCCGERMSDGCAMGGGCAMDHNILETSGCCDVSLEPLSDFSGITPLATVSQVALQNAPQPPPLVLFSASTLSGPKFNRISPPVSGRNGPRFVRTGIYLATNRLRI